jgi:ketosteroid isomerase-like protein
MRRWMTVMTLAGTLISGAAVVRAAPVDDVLAADRAFAAMAREKGARAAFIAFADPQAIMFRAGTGPVKGLEAIGGLFKEPAVSTPAWDPVGAEVAASGDLGYSWGWFAWSPVAGGPLDGKPPQTGYYVSIWKKQPDGGWKWVVDLGVPAPVEKR